MKQRVEKGAWRGPAALALALVYALAIEDLLDWLGPAGFALANAAVAAALWLLGDTAPHTVRYAASPPRLVDEADRVGAVDIMLLIAAGIVLAAVLMTVLPALLR